MKKVPRLFCILVITALLISSCGVPLQDSSGTESIATETENVTSTDIAQNTSSGYIEKYEIAVASTNNEKYPALAIHKNGERLVATTGVNVSGNTPAVTGAVWFSAEDQSVVLFNGEDGLPDKLVVGEVVIIFSNYTENSVDLGIVGADGETEILKNVPVDASDLLELRTLQSQTSNSVHAYKVAAPASSASFYLTNSQIKELFKIASLGLSLVSCVVAATTLGAATFGAALITIGFACNSIIIDAVEYFINDDVFPASTGFGLDAAKCAKSKDLFSCVSVILSATDLAISAAKNLIAVLEDQLTSTYTQITFASYEGESSYADKNTICTCRNCGDKELQARIIISEDGFVTGELKPFILSFSGTKDNITGVITDEEPNNCNSYCTKTLTAELTNDGQTLTGIVDETCTPGDCEFNNCVGTYTFSLNKK